WATSACFSKRSKKSVSWGMSRNMGARYGPRESRAKASTSRVRAWSAVHAGENAESVTGDPVPIARVLRGLLEDGDGRPLAGARVRAEAGGPDATTAPDGRFSLRLPAGDGPVALRVAEHGHDLRL